MNKTWMTNYIAEECGVSKRQSKDMINAFLEGVTKSLQEHGKCAFTGFGTFTKKHRKARMGVNPQNPSEKIQISARNVAKFKAGTELKSAVN